MIIRCDFPKYSQEKEGRKWPHPCTKGDINPKANDESPILEL